MLRSIGDDVDSCFREMAKCVDRGCGSSALLGGAVNARRSVHGKRNFDKWNMIDYMEVFEPAYEFSRNSVTVPFGLRGIPPLTPFQEFGGGTVPPWWTGYNQIKHQYYERMSEGNWQNVLSTLSGLLLLNLLHKCSQYYLAMTGTVRGGTKIGAFEQLVGYQHLTEELQKSALGIPSNSPGIVVVWLGTAVFYFEYRKV